MKYVIVVLALAIAALANSVYAGTGTPLMEGLKNPTELARLVELSLSTDPTGSVVLDAARCKRDGSCASAHDYFQGIRSKHPSAHLDDIAELPRYLRSLVKGKAPSGEWQMSRLLVNGVHHRYDATGWHRSFFPNELVWDDPNTGEHILAGTCGNVVGAQIVQPLPPIKQCVELTFNAPVGGHVRWGIGTTTGPIPPDECNAQRQDSMAWTAWYGECDICIPALSYIRGILGGSALVPHKYLYPVTNTRQTLRFSNEIWTKLVYICLEDAAGRQTCGVYMRPEDWKGRYRVDISDRFWFWDDKNCPQ